jgi:hypothetical protein
MHVRLLAAQLTGQAETDRAVPVPDHDWMISKLRKLRPSVSRYATVASLFRLTCLNPGQPVTFVQACNDARRAAPQGRGEIAAFTRMLHRDWMGHKWPLDYIERDGVGLYSATPALAKMWHAVLAEDAEEADSAA